MPEIPDENKNNVLLVPGLKDRSLEERDETLARLKRSAITIFKKHHSVILKAIGGSALLNAHSLALKLRTSCAEACGVDVCMIPFAEQTEIGGVRRQVRILKVEVR